MLPLHLLVLRHKPVAVMGFDRSEEIAVLSTAINLSLCVYIHRRLRSRYGFGDDVATSAARITAPAQPSWRCVIHNALPDGWQRRPDQNAR